MKAHETHNVAELITELTYCASIEKRKLLSDAADALEAADEKIADYTAAIDALDDSNDAYIKENERLKQRIAELEADKKTLINVVKDKSDFHATKDAMRIANLEAQLPKEGEWKKILQNDDGTSGYQCSACLGIIENIPDDDEHPLCSFCPNCGARMKGEKR